MEAEEERKKSRRHKRNRGIEKDKAKEAEEERRKIKKIKRERGSFRRVKAIGGRRREKKTDS